MRPNKNIFIILFTASLLLAFSADAVGSLSFLGRPIVDRLRDLIEFFLKATGEIALLVLVVSGIYYMLSGGNQKTAESAKKIMMAAITGLALVLLSYALLVLIEKIFVRP